MFIPAQQWQCITIPRPLAREVAAFQCQAVGGGRPMGSPGSSPGVAAPVFKYQIICQSSAHLHDASVYLQSQQPIGLSGAGVHKETHLLLS